VGRGVQKPQAHVERLVLPTVIEPLREKWDAARAAAFTLNMQATDRFVGFGWKAGC
jgi:hypothetical protein